MSYLVQTLITRAWYLSGIVSRQGQVVSGPQITDGLQLLNDVLAVKAVDIRKIPYYSGQVTTSCVIGQELYFIPYLASLSTLTFELSNVRIPIPQVGRDVYFGQPRVDGVNALPAYCFCERVNGGSNIYIYFPPDQTYPLNIVGKYYPQEITSLSSDLSVTFEHSYIEYIRYLLAAYMCDEYGYSFPPDNQRILDSYEKKYTDIGPLDLAIKKTSTLSKGRSLSWAWINFPSGYVPL